MTGTLFSETDVLIIGAGPAGRATKVFRGQADALKTRTMEILDSFEMTDGVSRDGAHLMESSFWGSDSEGSIKPVGSIPEYHPELSRFHETIINQGRIEREFLDTIKRFSGVEVERGVQPSRLEIDKTSLDDPQSHSVKVTVEHVSAEELASSPWSLPLPKVGDFNFSPGDEKELERGTSPKAGSTEVISAKYVIGADGSRSWTRNQLGFKLEGDGVDPVYGILDMVAKTDFPDVRKRALIYTPKGPCFFIPRENGMLRVALKLDTLDRSQVTPATFLKQLQDTIKPYKIECIHYDWHAIFQSNQRRSDHIAKFNRVFLAGDAIHTHSPKAGIGMNFSLQDSWKLVHVLKGFAKPSLLDTYISERRQVTEDLIKFDEELSAALLGVSPDPISVMEFSKKFFKEAWPFTSCTAIEYKPSAVVVMSKSKPEAASGLVVGQRFASQLVVNQASGQPVELQSRFPSNGKYRVVVFGGDISYPEQLFRLKIFGEAVVTRKSFSKFERTGGQLFELFLVHAARRDEVNWAEIPRIFRPWSAAGVEWYDGVWTDVFQYSDGVRQAYKGYGIDRKKGALVLVRPDGHVMFVNELEGLVDLECVLGNILFVAK